MIASVCVHVGCLQQIHKQFCQQQERIVNTKVCQSEHLHLMCLYYFSWECVTYLCATSLHGCMCILVSIWLYVYDWCMIVWQCAHDGMMTIIRPYTVSNSVSSNMIASVSIHVGWDTWWGSGRFRCRYLVRSRRFPLQIPVAVPEGSGADTWSASGGFLCRYLLRFLALVLLPLCSTIACLYVYDCICMIVWQCAHDVIVKVTRLLELVTAYSPTWLPMYEFTCLMTTMQGLMVAFCSLKSGNSLFLIPQLAAGDVPFWNGAVKKWNKAETSKLLGIAPGLIFKRVCYARRNVFEHQMAPVGSKGSNSSFWACPKNGIRMDT